MVQHIADSAAGSIVGTPAYLAPEVIRADDAMPYNPQVRILCFALREQLVKSGAPPAWQSFPMKL